MKNNKLLEKYKNSKFQSFLKFIFKKHGKNYKKLSTMQKRIIDLRDLVLIALFFFLIMQPFLLSSYHVPTNSMYPTIKAVTRLIGTPLPYGGFSNIGDFKMPGFKKIKRGDIVIFVNPLYKDNPKRENKYLVKRVIGMPGDVLQIIGKEVYINQKLYKEDYAHYQLNMPHRKGGTYSVGENEYFVMGDNRDNSRDSRYIGTIPKENIFGMPLFTFYVRDKMNGGKISFKDMFKIIK